MREHGTTPQRGAGGCGVGRRLAVSTTKTHFLNVDLELRATRDLSELVQALEPDVMTLTCMAVENGYLANLELASQPVDADTAIRGLVALVRKLPPRARAIWNEAERDFSIGVLVTGFSRFAREQKGRTPRRPGG